MTEGERSSYRGVAVHKVVEEEEGACMRLSRSRAEVKRGECLRGRFRQAGKRESAFSLRTRKKGGEKGATSRFPPVI